MNRQRLNTASTIKLGAWIAANQSADHKIVLGKLRDYAKQEGITLGEGSLSLLCKACGVTVEYRRKQPDGSYTDRVLVVAQSLVALMTKLGEPVPEELARIAQRRRPDDETVYSGNNGQHK